MRLIPVIDLLDAQVVHAVKGDREHYRPVKSTICRTADPLRVAAAFRDQLGLSDLYIADLNAIQGTGPAGHRELIAALAKWEKVNIILDAGVGDIAKARTWLDQGIHKVVIGAETLHALNALWEIPAGLDPAKLVFSLDMRAGKVLSRCSELTAMHPFKLLEQVRSAGWQEVLLLDLSRVGSERGIDRSPVLEARRSFPELSLLTGGGVTGIEELIELESAGVAGVLLATALHGGTIRAQDIAALKRDRA